MAMAAENALEAERVQVSLAHGGCRRLYGASHRPGGLQQGLALRRQPGRELLFPCSLHYVMLCLCDLIWLCSPRLACMPLPVSQQSHER